MRDVGDFMDRLPQKGLFLGEACVFLDRLPRGKVKAYAEE